MENGIKKKKDGEGIQARGCELRERNITDSNVLQERGMDIYIIIQEKKREREEYII